LAQANQEFTSPPLPARIRPSDDPNIKDDPNISREPEGIPDAQEDILTKDRLPPFPPSSTRAIFGIALAAVGLIVAAGGGIGGGGVLVPVFIMVCAYPAKLAIPLSNVTIFGGAIANCFLNLQKRHPHVDRPLIDYDLVNVMEPLTIAGAVIGSLVNKVTPGWIITVMLVVVLGATGIKTLRTGIKKWNKESEELALPGGGGVPAMKYNQIPSKRNLYGATGTPLDLSRMDFNELRQVARDAGAEEKAINLAWDRAELLQIIRSAKDPSNSRGNTAAANDKEYEQLIEEERHTPFNKILFLVIVFIGVISFGLLRGDTEGHGPLALECGSFWYDVLLLAPVPYVFVLAMFQRQQLIAAHEKKVSLDYYNRNPVEGDIQWDDTHTVVYPMICSLAGVCAGLFGIGGGIVKGPLMLEMGVDPQVSSGTSAFMILFTAGAASVSFALFGLLQLNYSVFFFVFGLIFTYIGQKLSNWAISNGGRSSIIIFIIAIVICSSTFLMAIEGVANAHDSWQHHNAQHLGLCAK